MKDSFESEFFAGNRQRLRTLFQGTAPIVLTAHGLLQRNGDNYYPFRQDSSFWCLTGIDMPDVRLVIDKEHEYLIMPEISPHEAVFNKPRDLDALRNRSGIKEIYEFKEGWKKLGGRLKKVKHVATVGAQSSYSDHYGFFVNPARSTLIAEIKQCNEHVTLLDIRQHLVLMRSVKQPVELDAIKKAIDITGKTIKHIAKRRSTYSFEHQVEADLTHGFRSRGARGHAFEPIVASGANSAILHYQANDAEIKDDLILLDVGAEFDQYAADVTRVIALGDVSKRKRLVHQTVREVQEYALSLVKPGAKLRENEQLIHQFMGEKLRELGLIKSIDTESVDKYYPHSTSHSMGLDVHDPLDYDRPLAPGVVITVEPGIYIPEEGFGIRIEDDVLITDKGYSVLTKNIPWEL